MNFNKSTIFYSSNTLEGRKCKISSLIGVRSSTNPEKYLGLPNVLGRRKKESFQNLKERIHAIIEDWIVKLLSQWGKEAFIKSVLQAIPTYVMSYFLLPKSFCGDLENVFAKFWWQKGYGKKEFVGASGSFCVDRKKRAEWVFRVWPNLILYY